MKKTLKEQFMVAGNILELSNGKRYLVGNQGNIMGKQYGYLIESFNDDMIHKDSLKASGIPLLKVNYVFEQKNGSLSNVLEDVGRTLYDFFDSRKEKTINEAPKSLFSIYVLKDKDGVFITRDRHSDKSKNIKDAKIYKTESSAKTALKLMFDSEEMEIIELLVSSSGRSVWI